VTTVATRRADSANPDANHTRFLRAVVMVDHTTEGRPALAGSRSAGRAPDK